MYCESSVDTSRVKWYIEIGIIVRMITLQPDLLGCTAMHYPFWPVYSTQMCILVPRLISVKCGAFLISAVYGRAAE
jgi:hypothetical protein